MSVGIVWNDKSTLSLILHHPHVETALVHGLLIGFKNFFTFITLYNLNYLFFFFTQTLFSPIVTVIIISAIIIVI